MTMHIPKTLGTMSYVPSCVQQEAAISWVVSSTHLEYSLWAEFLHVWATLKAILLERKELWAEDKLWLLELTPHKYLRWHLWPLWTCAAFPCVSCWAWKTLLLMPGNKEFWILFQYHHSKVFNTADALNIDMFIHNNHSQNLQGICNMGFSVFLPELKTGLLVCLTEPSAVGNCYSTVHLPAHSGLCLGFAPKKLSNYIL